MIGLDNHRQAACKNPCRLGNGCGFHLRTLWRDRLALHSRISPTRLFASRLPELYPRVMWHNFACTMTVTSFLRGQT
ncbi:MAG: hypothetical protein FWC97_12100 [Treponema sp.]|nr:hypothetical protein [Treponema sp.]